MNPEFQKALVEFLVRYQKVSIPDLGRFYLERNEEIILTDSALSPAQYNIEHLKNGKDNLSKFEDFLMNMFHFGKTKAKQFIKQSVNQIHDILTKQNKLVCRDLGEFTKDGEQIKFKAYNDYINDHSYGLPVIKLIPIIRTLEEKRALLEKSKIIPTQVGSNSRNNNFSEIVIISILSLLCIGALWLLFNAINKEKSVVPAQEIISATEHFQNQNIPFVLDSTNFNSQYDAMNSSQLDTYDHEIVIPIEDPSSVISNGIGKECVVIVGSFIQEVNKLRMIDKLENLGYEVHTEIYDDYN